MLGCHAPTYETVGDLAGILPVCLTQPVWFARELNLGAFSEWSEDERIAFLERELEGKRPLLPARMVMSPEVHAVSVQCRTLQCCMCVFCIRSHRSNGKLRNWGYFVHTVAQCCS